MMCLGLHAIGSHAKKLNNVTNLVLRKILYLPETITYLGLAYQNIK